MTSQVEDGSSFDHDGYNKGFVDLSEHLDKSAPPKLPKCNFLDKVMDYLSRKEVQSQQNSPCSDEVYSPIRMSLIQMKQ